MTTVQCLFPPPIWDSLSVHKTSLVRLRVRSHLTHHGRFLVRRLFLGCVRPQAGDLVPQPDLPPCRHLVRAAPAPTARPRPLRSTPARPRARDAAPRPGPPSPRTSPPSTRRAPWSAAAPGGLSARVVGCRSEGAYAADWEGGAVETGAGRWSADQMSALKV